MFDHSGPMLDASVFEVDIGRLLSLIILQKEEVDAAARRDRFCS